MSCPFNNRNFFWFGFIYLFYFSYMSWFVLLLSNRSNSKCFFFGFFLKICLIYNFGDEVFITCLESPKNENYELYLESNSNRNYKTLSLFLYDSFLFYYYYYITNSFFIKMDVFYLELYYFITLRDFYFIVSLFWCFVFGYLKLYIVFDIIIESH